MVKLKELRIEFGLKRSKVAADVGVSAGSLAHYENGVREAPYDTLIKFADYYNVSVDYILGREEGKKIYAISAAVLSFEEEELIKNFRACNKVGRSRILEYSELWSAQNGNG